MGRPSLNLEGKTFGRLSVLHSAGMSKGRQERRKKRQLLRMAA